VAQYSSVHYVPLSRRSHTSPTMCHCNEHKLYQRSPETEHFITAKISGNALKREYNTFSAASAQFTTAKSQGCANVSSNSSRSECMRRRWWTHRVGRLKFVNYTISENAHKVLKKIFVFYMTVMCITTGGQNRYRLVCRYDQSAWTSFVWASSSFMYC